MLKKKTSIYKHEGNYWSGAVPGLISVRDFVVDARSFYCPLPCSISFPSGRRTQNFSLNLGSHTKTWKVTQGKEYPFQWPKRKDLLQSIPASKFFLGMVVHMLNLLFKKKKKQVNHMQLDNFSVLCIQCGIISSLISLTHPSPQILSILYSNSLYAYFLCSFEIDSVIIGNADQHTYKSN